MPMRMDAAVFMVAALLIVPARAQSQTQVI
jgi:hypothetical protein